MIKMSHKLTAWIVWVLRVIVGGTFLFSGFVKCVDPSGFYLKLQEYLQVWGVHWLWRETVLTIAVTLSVAEFCGGFALITGCLRRTVCVFLTLFMVVMLPLTAYIAIYSPVSDCGCFGDVMIISNTATFLKNVFLTVCVVFLLKYNSRVGGLFPILSQVMPMIASVIYCLIISFIGIAVQPLIDFRPYKVDTPLVDADDINLRLIYEKEGERESFAIDSLPDSTWTYVARETTPKISKSGLAIFDGEDEVTDQVIDDKGVQILLIVPDIEHYGKSRASMANNINDYVVSHGGSMIGVVGASSEVLDNWINVAQPHFDVYSSDDTVLKQLVRGDAGLVYLDDGVIKWKRNIYSLFGDFPDFSAPGNQLASVKAVEKSHIFSTLTLIYIAILLAFFLLGLIRIKNDKKTEEKKS